MNKIKLIIFSIFISSLGLQSQVIEDFEAAGTWTWSPWLIGSGTNNGTKAAAAAYSGAFGWQAATSGYPWFYRTDVSIGNPGDVLGVWAKGNQRNYMGFGATGGGGWSLVLAPNTSGLIIQANAGWGYTDLATTPYTYNTANWYYLELTWNTTTNVTGRLYDNAMVLQATVNTNIATLVPNGISFRSYCTTICYFDDFNTSVILPIQLLEFTVTASENKNANVLNWVTGNEKNNKKFEVEKSVDGLSFESIGDLNGSGNSNVIHEYSFTDTKPNRGINYYRLRQFEFDGSSTVSKVISINNENSLNEISIFPSVTSGHTNLQFPITGEKEVLINDCTGKIVYSAKVIEDKLNLNLSFLNDGIYFVKVSNGTAEYNSKLVISK
ncbi:MAG: T9SS type A sorting domain-containing protein [Sphingobacteriaceae bacterium]|nr:T9SS type A sorting domain-containing protein [Sphingobacteriaceae bacterium]